MRNSVKLALIVIIAVLALCGCSGSLDTVDDMFGNGITNAIKTDSEGLNKLSAIALDNDIKSDFLDQEDANNRLRDELLAMELSSDSVKDGITLKNKYEEEVKINLKGTVAINYYAAAGSLTALVMQCITEELHSGDLLDINAAKRLVGKDYEGHEKEFERYEDDEVFNIANTAYTDSYKVCEPDITVKKAFGLDTDCEDKIEPSKGKINIEQSSLLNMYGLECDGETMEQSNASYSADYWIDRITEAYKEFSDIPKEFSTAWLEKKYTMASTKKFRIYVDPVGSTAWYEPGTFNVTVTDLSVNKEVLKLKIELEEDNIPAVIRALSHKKDKAVSEPKQVNLFSDKASETIKDNIKAMGQGEIYVLKADADIDAAKQISSGNITDAVKSQFKETDYEKRLVTNNNSEELLAKEAFKNLTIPLQVTGGVALGYIKKKSVNWDYINQFYGCSTGDVTPLFVFSRDANNSKKGRLYLIKYPVARVSRVELDSGNYVIKTKDSGMWTMLGYGTALYNSKTSTDARLSRSSNIYLYDDSSIAWLKNFSVKYDVKELKGLGDKFEIVAQKEGADSSFKSHFLLMSYLEGLYLPGTYPKGAAADSSNVENVLALGRRIQLDKNAISDNKLKYSDKIGDITSAVNGSSVAINSMNEVMVSNLVSASRGAVKVGTAVSGVDAVLESVKVDFEGATTTLPANATEPMYVLKNKKNGTYVDVGGYAKGKKTPGNNNQQCDILPIKYEVDGSGNIDIYFGYEGYVDSGYGYAPYTLDNGAYTIWNGPDGLSFPVVTYYKLNDIKANVTEAGSSQYSTGNVNITSKGRQAKLTLKRSGSGNVESSTIYVKIEKSNNSPGNTAKTFSVALKFDYPSSTGISKTSSAGGPILLASSYSQVGKTGGVFGNTTYEQIFSEKVDICQLKYPGDGTTSEVLAHEETPDSDKGLPRLFVMGTSFNVHDNDFEKWLNEAQDVDPDNDGNLRKWIGVLQGYGYKNYPCEADGVDAIIDTIADAFSRIYNFGSIEEKDSTIILDTAVLAKVQEDIDNNILINEAKIIRAVTKILGILLSFIGFLWLVAWLVDAGTTGDGNGALYFVTFKHMRTGAGMSKKEAIEMSTEGYKYVTAAGIAKRVFILMALGVTLIIVDPINLVSTIISWVDGAYRLIRENIFNVRDNIG